MNFINFKKNNENAIKPTSATEGSAGYDLYACLEEPKTLLPNEIMKIPLGFSIEINSKNIVAYVFSRSSLGIKGVTVANSVGIIDSDYRGEIFVTLINHGKKGFTINNHDRIAQMIFSPVFLPEFKEVNTLNETKRGAGGFGSTGK